MYRWLVLIVVIIVFNSTTFANDISGYLNLNNNSIKQYEDGKRLSELDTFFQNFYLRLDKSITSMLSYQLYLRESLSDSKNVDAQGEAIYTFQRTIEPSLDFFFRNPIYDLSTGYRRQEQWSTASLTDGGRKTTEFSYARLNITPYEIPSFSFQFDKQSDFDYLKVKNIDEDRSRYYASSWYQYTGKDINFSYNFNYTRNINKNDVKTAIIEKTVVDMFNGLYTFGYSMPLLNNKAHLSAGYRGNYTRIQNLLFAVTTGNVSFKREPISGLYSLDTTPQQIGSLELMSRRGDLTDGIFIPTTIDLFSDDFNNIGIDTTLAFSQSVDEIRIYVDKNLSAETVLNNAINWEVYSTNSDPTNIAFIPLIWASVPIISVNVKQDIIGRWYYEIKIPLRVANFLKVVNKAKSNLINVKVTEVEAYGTDIIPETGEIRNISELFTQGINLDLNFTPVSDLMLALNYSIDRTDQNVKSILESVGGIFNNIVTKSKSKGKEDFRSIVTRNYGASSIWKAHRLLTTTFRIQRSESFDNKGETDLSFNTYTLSFDSAILPTLYTTLSLIRTNSYSFSEKLSKNDSILWNIIAKLYKDVNLNTDIGYFRSIDFKTDTESTTRHIKSTIDALFTKRLFGTFTSNFTWTTSGPKTTKTRDGSLTLTYRPGRFINLTALLKAAYTDGNRSNTEGILIDWLPVPALRLNLNYQHSFAEQGSVTSDTIQSYVIWYITKFMDFQVTTSYVRNVAEKTAETYNLGFNLNCRFW